MHTHQLPSGRWRTIVQHQGRRAGVTADTRAESRRQAARLLIGLGGSALDETTTVAELLDEHLARQAIAPATKEAYERVRRLHLPVDFQARPVAGVTPPVIDVLYRRLEADGVAAGPIRRLNALLSGAFKRGVRSGLTTLNPCRDATVPPEGEPDTRVPETDEARTLLAACDEISAAFGLFARIAANTGGRPGEVVALQRRDVDVDERTVSYLRAVSRVRGGAFVGPLKTGHKGQRKVAIGPGLAARIGEHLLGQDLEVLGLGGGLGPATWLFTEDYAAPWYPSTPSRWWRRARDACGIGDVRLYDLRHYVATEIYAGGFDDQTAMRRLGHTNPVTTAKRYATSRPARDRAAAEWLEGELGG